MRNYIYRQSNFDVSPNTATSFALETVERKLLASPYRSNCIDHWNQTRTTMYTKFMTFFGIVSYDEFFCHDICQLEHTLHHCGSCLWRKYDRINFNSIGALGEKFQKRKFKVPP